MAKLKRPPLAAPGLAPSSSDAPAVRGREVGGPNDPRQVLYGRPTLTPAMTFFLMTGRWADARLPGWVSAAQAGLYGEPTPEAVWAEQAESLVSEARAAGFEPYGLTKKRPRGAAVEQWRAAFLDAHRY